MKKDSWSKLPNEILLNIFQRNDNSTNSQCSLTCRDWKYTAQCALFEKISILSEEQLIELSNALSIDQNNSYSANSVQSLGNYVKIVNCELSSNTFDWNLLDRLFPFLEVIKTSNMIELHYSNLYNLLKEGKFPHLKTLPTTESNMPPTDLLLARKEKIEELTLYSTNLEDKIHQNLHLFPNLKTLHLNYPQEVHLEHLFSIEIKHLKSISIYELDFRNFDTSLLNMDDIQSFSNTKELCIDYDNTRGILSPFHYYDDKYILYIMKKFPNLETLWLINGPQYNGRDNGYSTIDCLFQFLVYLFKMKKFSLVDIVTNKFTKKLVKKFLNYVIDQQTVYYKNMNIDLQIMFEFVHPGEEHIFPPDLTEDITIRNQKAGYKHYKKDECKLEVNYYVRQEKTFQSHLQLFREIGNLNIINLTIRDDFAYPSTRLVILEEIFIHFSNLENLTISDVSNFIWNKEEYIVDKTPNSTIKYMQFKKCTLSKDMFPIISKRCQNLKALDLVHCRYTNNDEDQTISHYLPIIMPFTCLEVLKIELDYRYKFSKKNVFIRLITNNKKPRYCKITTATDSPNFAEQDCTEAHYNMCLHDNKYVVYDIHCDSVVKLIVQLEGYNDRNSSEYRWRSEKKEYIEEDL